MSYTKAQERGNMSTLVELVSEGILSEEQSTQIQETLDSSGAIFIGGTVGPTKTRVLNAMVKHFAPTTQMIAVQSQSEYSVIEAGCANVLVLRSNKVTEATPETTATLYRSGLRFRPKAIFVDDYPKNQALPALPDGSGSFSLVRPDAVEVFTVLSSDVDKMKTLFSDSRPDALFIQLV